MLSSTAPCPSGVPQGSVISLILFNVHINYLEDTMPNHINVNASKYADDCTLDIVVERGTGSHMQEAIEVVSSWAVTNRMVLSAKTTKDMWVSFSTTRIHIGN